MEKYVFEIDGIISKWEFSKQYVKHCLSKAVSSPAVCRVCSYGGDFLEAISIKDEFARHGQVTLDISGYAASAATLIGLGACSTRMTDTSFYLVHKVLSPIEIYRKMNEDDLAVLISDLTKIKDENERMTLVIANSYAEKCKKPVIDILNLMKEEKWLTADEAKEWGFVDEVYKASASQKINNVNAKLNLVGLPELPVKTNAQEGFISRIVGAVLNALPAVQEAQLTTQEHQIINNNQISMEKFEKLNVALGVSSLESADGKSVYLNVTQLQALETVLSNYAQEVESGKTNKTTFDNGIERLNALHPDVASAVDFTAKLDVLAAKLAEKPGVIPSGAKEPVAPVNDGVDWDKLNNLPHMQVAPSSLV